MIILSICKRIYMLNFKNSEDYKSLEFFKFCILWKNGTFTTLKAKKHGKFVVAMLTN